MSQVLSSMLARPDSVIHNAMWQAGAGLNSHCAGNSSTTTLFPNLLGSDKFLSGSRGCNTCEANEARSEPGSLSVRRCHITDLVHAGNCDSLLHCVPLTKPRTKWQSLSCKCKTCA